jgi:thymidylate synthase (FAD)
MRVKLIAHTEVVADIPDYQPHEAAHLRYELTDADDLAEQAGRLCYLSWDRPSQRTADNQGYLDNIITQSHFSILEHASASFYIDGVTRNFTHELIRHRHLSFSEVSQRYVDASDFQFVDHPGLADVSGLSEMAYLREAVRTNVNVYDMLVNNLTEQGQPRKNARQAARHILPGGIETKIIVTGNMRAWREVLWKRISPAADLEFQQVARLILSELKRIAPNSFQDFPDSAVLPAAFKTTK